jgi:iron complex transport system substrate-binding protein
MRGKKEKMKTKKKMIALLEIAIVLCSVFLVAIPAIAADQTTQKAITTASEDDYVLGIYGNANEDDTIDMGDVVYIKLAIFGKKPKTELCDAKYDGLVNVLDVIQTKLIILGKEKEITIEDTAGEAVTIHKPVKRMAFFGACLVLPDTIKALNAEDKVVGVGHRLITKYPVYFPELSKLPCIGKRGSPDYEAILNLKPDILIIVTRGGKVVEEKLPGVTVISLPLMVGADPMKFVETVTKLGYILDAKEEAEEYLNWREGWLNDIEPRIAGLSGDEKQQVVALDTWKQFRAFTRYSSNHMRIVTAGGKNIAEELEVVGGTSLVSVDPEWIIVQNPDIILIHIWEWGIHGYGVDDTSEMKARREAFMNRPEFANVIAVKTGRVYLHSRDILYGAGGGVACAAYFAKWFYPDLFEDIDPQAIHQEYLTEFQGLDYDLDKHGVFVYPEEPV